MTNIKQYFKRNSIIATNSTNTKVLKSNKHNKDFRLASLSMKPNLTICPASKSAGCLKLCLVNSGRGAMSSVDKARSLRSDYYMKHKELFIAQVHKELTNYEKTCKKQGVIPTVRLNTISDIAYELTDIIVKHPNILFIDYTKRARRLKDVNKLHNYKVIFSYSGKATYQKQVEIALQYNNPVAVVFEKYLPKTFLGREVIDGDISDIDNALYSNDKIVGLKLKKSKGYQEFLNSGFVVYKIQKERRLDMLDYLQSKQFLIDALNLLLISITTFLLTCFFIVLA